MFFVVVLGFFCGGLVVFVLLWFGFGWFFLRVGLFKLAAVNLQYLLGFPCFYAFMG